MKTIPPSVGYWIWYVENVKAILNRPLTPLEYKDMMKAYISGVPFQKHAQEMMK